MHRSDQPSDDTRGSDRNPSPGGPQPPWRAELEALCERAIEGRLDVAGRDRIEALVRGDRAACRFYVDYLHHHAALSWAAGRAEMIGVATGVQSTSAEGRPAIAPVSDEHLLDGPSGDAFESDRASALEPAQSLAASRRIPRALRIALATLSAAAVLMLGLWLGHRSSTTAPNITTAQAPSAPPVIAELVSSKAAKWASGTLPTADGASLTAGRLHLAEGVARLKFARGAEVSLEGPAELELVSADKCVLASGRLVAKVPQQAIGFIVDTPPAVLKDMGTEFGVSVRGPDSADVTVFDGLVDVVERSTGKVQQIKQGNTARVQAKQLTVIPTSSEIPPPPAALGDATTLAVLDTSRRAVQISSLSGRGKDASILSSDPRAQPGQLQVKNVDKANSPFQRKSYVAFDVGSIAGETLRSARVEFTLVPPTSVPRFPDATFAVYGLNDGPADEWDEKTIDWTNAPANGPGGAGVDPKKAVLLGRFVVPQGARDGTFGVEGEALARFLQSDRNGLATMIVVRETSHAVETSMIHSFVGWSHTSGKPPTLKLTTAARGDVEITNATGRGKDAFICFYGTTPPASASPGVLSVKNAGRVDSPYHRKAYVAFDLAPIAGETVLGGRVEFTLLPTAFSSRFPDATFAVYGVSLDALDAWDEKDIKWCNAPATTDRGDAVSHAQAVLLGRFTVEKGVQQGTFGVEGDALRDLLKSDRNGLLTVILVRETAGEDETSVIHNFAGRHHPWATPPTLKLSLRASSGDRRQLKSAAASSNATARPS